VPQAFTLVLVLLVSTPAFAQPAAESPLVVTMGEGVVHAVPDRAWITIGAESRAQSPAEAQRRNAEAMRPVQEKLRSAGVAAEAIRTSSYDLQYEWDYQDGRRVGRGYVARNTIEVRVDAIDRVGEYLEIAVGSGATTLGGIRFDLKDRAALEREALRLAVADAVARAAAIAAAANGTIGQLVRIQEQGAAAAPPMPMPMLRQAAEAAAPPIATGELEVRAGVTLTVALE
jgi:uncharacterized protein YggE